MFSNIAELSTEQRDRDHRAAERMLGLKIVGQFQVRQQGWKKTLIEYRWRDQIWVDMYGGFKSTAKLDWSSSQTGEKRCGGGGGLLRIKEIILLMVNILVSFNTEQRKN